MVNNYGQTDSNESSDLNSSKDNGDSQQDSKPHIQKSETEGKGVNPGRTPGKAEGVEEPEERGNQ